MGLARVHTASSSAGHARASSTGFSPSTQTSNTHGNPTTLLTLHPGSGTHAAVGSQPGAAPRSQTPQTVTLDIGGAITLTGTYTATGDGSDANPLATIDNMTVTFTGPLAGWQTTGTVSGVKLYTAAADVPSFTLNITGSAGTILQFSGSQAVVKAVRLTFTNNAGALSGFAVVGGAADLIAVQGASVTAAGVTLTAPVVTLGVTAEGKFQVSVPDSAPLTLKVGTILTVNFWGTLSSDAYDLNGAATLALGDNNYVGLSGAATFKLTNTSTPNLSATVQGGLYLLGTQVAGLDGAISFTANANVLSFSIAVKFQLAKGAFNIEVKANVSIAPDGVNVSWDGTATLWGRFKFASTGFVKSDGTWEVNGSFTVNAGFSFFVVSGSVEATAAVHVTNTTWSITVSGTATGKFFWFSKTVTLAVSVNNDGVFSVSLGGTTINVSLSDGLKVWSSDLGGSVVFVDRNGDGIPQSNELGGTADSSGDFAFQDQSLFKQFDTNGDHVLSSTEIGSFFEKFSDFDTNHDGFLSPDEAKALLGDFSTFDLHEEGALGPEEVPFLTPAQFAKYDANGDGVLTSDEATFVSDLSFWDKNGDGQLSPEETAPLIKNMASFDTDGDGVLTEDEAEAFFNWYNADAGNQPVGRIVTVLGGRDTTTGLPNIVILRALGTEFGTLDPIASSPLSTLQVAAMEIGLDGTDATRLMAEGLGLPPTVSATSVDPNALPGSLTSDTGLFLSRAEQLTALVVNGAALLQAANPSLTDFQAQSAIWHALAYEIYDVKTGKHGVDATAEVAAYKEPAWDQNSVTTDANGQITGLAGGATFSLSSEANAQYVIDDAAAETSTNLTPAQTGAYATVTSQMNALIDTLAGSGGDLKFKLAQAKAVTQNETASAMRQMAAGITSSSDVLNRYTGANLAAAVSSMTLPISGPPVISTIPNQQVQPGKALTVPFDVTNVLGKAADLSVSVSSSNPDLVPQDQDHLTLTGNGLLRTLAIQPLDGHTGISTITLKVADGTQTTTQSFQVGTAAQAVSWSSVSNHGAGLGDLGLVLPADGSFTESRAAGVTKLVVKFDSPIDPTSITPSSVGLLGVSGPASAPLDLSNVTISTGVQDNNTSVAISFSQSLPDVARYQVLLTGLKDIFGNVIVANNTRIFSALAGDANGDGVVNNTDVGGVKSLLSSPAVNPANVYSIRSDLDSSGDVTGLDVAALYPYRGHDARFLLNPNHPSSNLSVATRSISVGLPGYRGELGTFASPPRIQTSETLSEDPIVEDDSPMSPAPQYLSLAARSHRVGRGARSLKPVITPAFTQ